MRLKIENLELDIKRVVVKLGTKQVTNVKEVNYANIAKLVAEMMEFRKQGVEFVLTVSGAVGLGLFEFRSSMSGDKISIPEKQALAGVGQVKLMNLFSEEFAKYDVKAGQVLLTHAIFDNRSAYLNARNTLNTMLELGIIPVINENDSVAVEEIKLGDNDRLGALVALLTDADLYIMLSDIDGFYTDYGKDTMQLQRSVDIDALESMKRHAAGKAEFFTSGGMMTKLEAAKMTNLSCIPSVIANGFTESILSKVLNNIEAGTIFLSNRCSLNYKKRWITSKKSRGKIVVDDGAAKAIQSNKSLLPSGVKRIEGSFKEGDRVTVVDEKGIEIAVGLSNYNAKEATLIAGKHSAELEAALGYKSKYLNVIHIDNLVAL